MTGGIVVPVDVLAGEVDCSVVAGECGVVRSVDVVADGVVCSVDLVAG